ncbi:alpha/beta hydrolase [Anaeromyxobacter sp. Red801]|uniref:alpha/beta hydrolase n=1 Tax=Anaeromyxobacter sp. Red801 TaxID=3411632 RepID=UPI003BA19369
MPQVDLTGPAGRLEALLEEVPGARFAALVCHPHPRFGGTMHNHATYRLARAVRAQGGHTLRFNYRGVGLSAGAYDRGLGEVEDTRAALGWLAARHPDLPLLCCGFSFGSWMTILAGGPDPRVRGLLLAGLALRSADLDLVRDAADARAVEQPAAVVQAERDAFGLPDDVRAVLEGSRGPRRLAVVPGTTHLFTEDLPALQREAEAALGWLLEEARIP